MSFFVRETSFIITKKMFKGTHKPFFLRFTEESALALYGASLQK